jgi:hypothetical protein
MRSAVSFVPIVTTVLALLFARMVFARYRAKGGRHLLWWGIGMLTYAAGTATESVTTLWGWHAPVFRLWYVTGALLGGAPLAQGTVYLLLPRRTADRLAALLVCAVTFGAVCVWLSPLDLAMVEPYRLSGRVLVWRWVRGISPFINLYAVTFLVGGAVLSAVRYWRQDETRRRALANAWIAIGAILPGIGGAFTRLGHVEVLYVTECIGLLMILVGYRLSVDGGSTRPARPLSDPVRAA